jgi:hypothetical protein
MSVAEIYGTCGFGSSIGVPLPHDSPRNCRESSQPTLQIVKSAHALDDIALGLL